MTINIKKLKEKIHLYTLAKEMSIPPTTIYSWAQKNKIPAWRVDNIITACDRLGVDLSDCKKEQ